MLKKLYQLSLIAVLVLSAAAWPAAARAQSDITLFVTAPAHADNFPVVQLDVRAINSSNLVVNNLSNSSLAVYENGQAIKDFQVQAKQDGALQIIFVVDLSQYTNQQLNLVGLADLQAAFTTLVTGGYFVDGRDSVQVLKRVFSNSDQTVEVLPPTQKGVDLTKWVQNFDFKGAAGPTKGLLGVDDAIKTAAGANGTRTTAVIYVGYRIDDPPANVLVNAATGEAQKAKDAHVLVYAFHSGSTGTFYGDAALRTLATSTGGTYLHLQRGSVGTSVAGVYGALNAMRTIYTVSYRSSAASSGQRQVAVAPSGAAADSPQAATTSYNVTIQSPVAAITAPADGAVITRDLGNSSQKVPVTAKVDSWPDGHPRNIASAQLIVNGLTVQTVNKPNKDGLFEFSWDVSGINEPGDHDTPLEVRLVDELGEEATATVTVKVTVPAQATLTAVGQTTFCAQNPNDPSCKPAPPPGPLTWMWVVVGILLLFIFVAAAVVLVFVIGQLRKKPEAGAGAQAGPEVGSETIVVESGHAQPAALAQLKITQGPPGTAGTTINITRTTTVLGRAPQMADVVFYAEDEHSVVSRRHCTLETDGNAFTITDHSANGTSVNGQRLTRDVPTVLADGDQVMLGAASDQLAVKFTFSILIGKTQLWTPGAMGQADVQAGYGAAPRPSAGSAARGLAGAAPKSSTARSPWLLFAVIALVLLLVLACVVIAVAGWYLSSRGQAPGLSQRPVVTLTMMLPTVAQLAALTPTRARPTKTPAGPAADTPASAVTQGGAATSPAPPPMPSPQPASTLCSTGQPPVKAGSASYNALTVNAKFYACGSSQTCGAVVFANSGGAEYVIQVDKKSYGPGKAAVLQGKGFAFVSAADPDEYSVYISVPANTPALNVCLQFDAPPDEANTFILQWVAEGSAIGTSLQMPLTAP